MELSVQRKKKRLDKKNHLFQGDFLFSKKVLGTLVVTQHRSGNQVASYFKATSRHTEEFA